MRADPDTIGRKRRWGLRATALASVAVLAAGGAGHQLMHGLNSGLHRLDPFHDLAHRPANTTGEDVLVVGTDRRAGLSPAERRKYNLGGQACDCTDTLMLVHLSASHDRASVISLPRDSYTVLPAWTDRAGRHHPAAPAKLNSAYARGGPSLTVSTVERMTGIHLDHYMEIDFTSFMRTVDELGGVKICTDHPLHDHYSGLDLPAGTSKLDGGRALQYVRARHLGDGSDLARMKRQQRFLASVLAQATGDGVLMNPVKFDRVASTALHSVRADSKLSSSQMLELARALRKLSPKSSEFVSVPLSDPNYQVPGIGSTVRWDRTKARRIFSRIQHDQPLTAHHRSASTDGAPGDRRPGALRPGDLRQALDVAIPPASIRVQVDNGSGRPGLARTVDGALRATGFATTGAPRTAHGTRHVRTTVIRYDPRWSRSAHSLAQALPGARLVPDPGRGPQLHVTVGTDRSGPTAPGVRPVHAAPPGQPPARTADTLTGPHADCG